MENFKRIALVSIVSFLGFSALSITIFGAVGESGVLSSSHTQEMECERDMQDKLLEEQKLLKQLEAINMDLEALRECRDSAVQDRVDWMNTAEAADFEYTFGEKLEEYTEIMPEDTFDFNKFDISKLAYAVAMAETADCTTGMGVSKNNCFGIMEWPAWNNYQRTGKTYATKDEAYADFSRIWTSFYGEYPTYAMAVKWSGNDHPDNWLSIVNQYYHQS